MTGSCEFFLWKPNANFSREDPWNENFPGTNIPQRTGRYSAYFFVPRSLSHSIQWNHMLRDPVLCAAVWHRHVPRSDCDNSQLQRCGTSQNPNMVRERCLGMRRRSIQIHPWRVSACRLCVLSLGFLSAFNISAAPALAVTSSS